MRFLLTIAVPTYNIEHYIQRNIESFQKVSDNLKELFEVLIVNDGSTDESIKVAMEIINKDENLNIRIINKQNGGHGSAVNKGIEQAKGKYFKIIDGDDWINPKAFEIYLKRLLVEESDMIITNFRKQFIQDGTNELIKALDFKDNTRFTQYPLQRIYMHSITYKTKVLADNHIRLSEGVFYVDMQYVYFPQKFVQTIVYWDLDIYQYLLGRSEQSVNFKSLLRNESHHLLVTESLLALYDESKDIYLRNLYTVPLDSMINTTFLILGLNKSTNKVREFARKVHDSDFKYKYSSGRKTSYLMYIGETKASFFKPLLDLVIDSKLKKMTKEIEED